MSYLILAEGVSWSWSQAGEQRVGLLIHPKAQVLFFRWVAIAWGGKAEIQGEVLLGDSQLHLHQEDSVMVGEDLVYFSF